jgi:flagellar protein FliO/FliZ
VGSFGGEAVRLVLSLGVVLGLMWLAARVLRGKAVRHGGDAVTVLGRAQLARGAAVAVVQVAGRELVLGVTEQRVCLLAEAAAETGAETPAEEPATPQRSAAASPRLSGTTRVVSAGPDQPSGPLAGSVLSPQTWRQAVEALRDRTVRRG